jgi:hypothetical protein
MLGKSVKLFDGWEAIDRIPSGQRTRKPVRGLHGKLRMEGLIIRGEKLNNMEALNTVIQLCAVEHPVNLSRLHKSLAVGTALKLSIDTAVNNDREY